MSFIIEDGGGTGKVGIITSRNQLLTASVSLDDAADATLRGKAFSLNTALITLTSANPSVVFYLKNTDTENLVLTNIVVGIGPSTGGSGPVTVEVIKNPTAGTIVDTATNSLVFNRNFGSTIELNADKYDGAEGLTLTDGEIITTNVLLADSVIQQDTTIVFTPSTSIGFRITPPASNTSMVVSFATSLHLDGFGT